MPTSSGAASVTMMQAADLRNGEHKSALGRLDLAWDGFVSIQRQVRSGMMIVLQVRSEGALQVACRHADGLKPPSVSQAPTASLPPRSLG